jgi:hypothetical protein
MSIKNNKKKGARFLVGGILVTVIFGCFTVLWTHQIFRQHDRNLADLKKRLQQEMHLQIAQQVKTEVAYQVKQLAQQKQQQHCMEQFAQRMDSQPEASAPISARTSVDSARSKQEPVYGYRVPDHELQTYIASGGVSQDISLPDGLNLKKRQNRYPIQLAKADTDERQRINVAGAVSDFNQTAGEDKAESLERTLAQKGGMLLQKGKGVIVPSFAWAHFSSNVIHLQGFVLLPLYIGDISTQTIRRDIFIETLGLKYGLLDNFQAELKVPYRHQYERVTDNSLLTETVTKGKGLGDIEFGLSRQIGWENGFIPDLVAAINVKSDTGDGYQDLATGTGHWALRASLIAAKSSDPAVIFSSLTYAHSFKRNIDGQGEMAPGDTIGYSLGAAIALSYQTAINFSFDHSVTFKTKRNGRVIKGTFLNVANLKIGFNWSIDENTSVDVAVSAGLTEDAPDVTAMVSVPIKF